VKNEVLRRVKKERNILPTIKRRRRTNWLGHILRRDCLLKHAIEGKIEWKLEVALKRGRWCKQLLDYVKETRGSWKLKRGSTRSHSVENSVWKTLWSCHKAEYGMNGYCVARGTNYEPARRMILCYLRVLPSF
jgi:hypothetical protein